MAAGPTPPAGTPFPDSLCHGCAAPARLVTSDRGTVFIHCPIFRRYPPQPVRSCEAYRPGPVAERNA